MDKIRAITVEYTDGMAKRFEGAGSILSSHTHNSPQRSMPAPDSSHNIHVVSAHLQVVSKPWPRASNFEAARSPHALLGELVEFVALNFTEEGRYKHDPAGTSHPLMPPFVRGTGAAWGPWQR